MSHPRLEASQVDSLLSTYQTDWHRSLGPSSRGSIRSLEVLPFMRGFVRFLLWTSLVLGVIGGVLYLAVFEVWTIPSDDPQLAVALQPNLFPGDVLLVARHSRADRGELVRCLDPDAPGRFVVARVVGEPGEDVTFQQDTMRINGKREPTGSPCDPARLTLTAPQTQAEVELACHFEEFAGRTQGILRGAGDFDQEFPATKVEAGRIFLASDNRRLHLDSRDFGQLNPDTCLQIVYRLWGTGGLGDSKRRFTFLW
jgi:signal peptidase I